MKAKILTALALAGAVAGAGCRSVHMPATLILLPYRATVIVSAGVASNAASTATNTMEGGGKVDATIPLK